MAVKVCLIQISQRQDSRKVTNVIQMQLKCDDSILLIRNYF